MFFAVVTIYANVFPFFVFHSFYTKTNMPGSFLFYMTFKSIKSKKSFYLLHFKKCKNVALFKFRFIVRLE